MSMDLTTEQGLRCALDGAEIPEEHTRIATHYDDGGALDGIVVYGKRRAVLHQCGVDFATSSAARRRPPV